MSRYAVRRVSLGSTLKFGLVLGTLLSLLPGCLCGLLSLWLIGGLRGFLEGWKQGGIVILGQKIPIDFIDLMRLGGVLNGLRALDDLGLLLAAIIALAVILAAVLIIAGVLLLVGVGYNLLAATTGGLVIELERAEPLCAVSVPARSVSPPTG